MEDGDDDVELLDDDDDDDDAQPAVQKRQVKKTNAYKVTIKGKGRTKAEPKQVDICLEGDWHKWQPPHDRERGYR
jgi:hypothetical protein